MNPVLQALLSAVLKYVQSHPEVLDQLVEQFVAFIAAELKKAATPAA